MIALLSQDETNAIHTAILLTIMGIEKEFLATKDEELLKNLKSALKKLRGENG